MHSGVIAAAAAKKEEKPGLLTLLVEDCLKNPYIWLFAISYFFVYVVRQGVTSWFIFYLKACTNRHPLHACLHALAACLSHPRTGSLGKCLVV